MARINNTTVLRFPFELNSVYVKPSPGFLGSTRQPAGPALTVQLRKSPYHGRAFPGCTPTRRSDPTRFWFLRANFEMSGLVMRGIAPLFNWEPERRRRLYIFRHQVFAVHKPDVDVSYHHILNKNNTLVYRVATGIGLPGNSRALPFEKSFFAGGASSVRAWSARTLGRALTMNRSTSNRAVISSSKPMSSTVPSSLQLFGSTILEGAAFVDAGNVWTRNEDASRPGSQFRISTFARELGIGGGLGMRFNFSFFILRLDMAVKLHDPSLDLSERWVYPNQKFVIGDIVPNLAIGYPSDGSWFRVPGFEFRVCSWLVIGDW